MVAFLVLTTALVFCTATVLARRRVKKPGSPIFLRLAAATVFFVPSIWLLFHVYHELGTETVLVAARRFGPVTDTYSLAEDPIRFWLHVGIFWLIGVFTSAAGTLFLLPSGRRDEA